MAKVIIPVGLPGSGKTTYSKTLKNTVVISADRIANRMYPRTEITPYNYRNIFLRMMYICRKNLEEGKDVFLDATNLTRSKRSSMMREVRSKFPDAEFECVFFNVSPEVAWARNCKRTGKAFVPEASFLRLVNNLEVPDMDEGWARILVRN